jgi:hypothetical protein
VGSGNSAAAHMKALEAMGNRVEIVAKVDIEIGMTDGPSPR